MFHSYKEGKGKERQPLFAHTSTPEGKKEPGKRRRGEGKKGLNNNSSPVKGGRGGGGGSSSLVLLGREKGGS